MLTMKRIIILKAVFLILSVTFINNLVSAQWIQTSGPSGGVIEALAVSGVYLVAGTYGGGTYRTSDNGVTWTKTVSGLLNTNVNALAVADTNLYAGTFGGVYRSVNGAATWTSTGLSFNNLVQSLAVSGKTLLAGTRNGPFLSTDNGASWKAINNGLSTLSITAVAISDTNFFAGTEAGIYRSPISGARWTAVNTGLNNTSISCFAFNGTYLMASTANGVYLTSNSGTLWSQVYSGLGTGSVESLFVYGTNLFAAVRGSGVFRLDTSAKVWVNTGMPEVNVFSLAVLGNVLFAGTGTSVWRRPLSEILTGTIDNLQLTAGFKLFQNLPNPFRSSTFIGYSLPVSGTVELSVYNMQGQKVSVLANEFKTAGRYSAVFEKTCLPAGVYYCRLKAGPLVQTMKMIMEE